MTKIMDILKSDTKFYTFVQMLKLTQVIEKLYGKGPYTIFAPNNDAFGELPSEELTELTHDIKSLKKILLYHIIPGEYDSTKLRGVDSIATLEGQDLQIRFDEKILVNGGSIIKPNISTLNGIIHEIDTVLRPPEILAAI